MAGEYLHDWCDLNCKHAKFLDSNAFDGACNRELSIYCTILESPVLKNARCQVRKTEFISPKTQIIKNFEKRLEEAGSPEGRILLLDGATSTELIARGLTKGDVPDLWNINRAGDVADVHKAYFDAGSDIVQTNTFGASPVRLKRSGLADRCEEINAAAARLLLSVTPPDRFASGNIGPSGEMLPPVGNMDETELAESFAVQTGSLYQNKIRIVTIETMMDLREAVIAVKAAVDAGFIVIALMTYNRSKKGFHTLMGDSPADCAGALTDAGAAVVGANCSLTSGDMLDLARTLVDVSPVPVAVQPNAGQPVPTRNGIEYDADPETFTEDLARMREAGVAMLGGCCGTTPDFIRHLAEHFRAE